MVVSACGGLGYGSRSGVCACGGLLLDVGSLFVVALQTKLNFAMCSQK